MPTPLITPYATLSFPNLFQPRAMVEGGEAKYGCALLFDAAAQQSPQFKAMQKAVHDICKDKFPNVNLNTLVLPFKDAGEKSDRYQGYEEGVIVIDAKSKQKPGIVDARNQDILLPEQVYAGQVVRAQLMPFHWNQAGRRGVSFGLNHIQIVKHDAPRIDGRVAAKNAFDVIDEEEDSPF
jgi:Enterobacter phage Enc34, ssDNA-binding protein